MRAPSFVGPLKKILGDGQEGDLLEASQWTVVALARLQIQHGAVIE